VVLVAVGHGVGVALVAVLGEIVDRGHERLLGVAIDIVPLAVELHAGVGLGQVALGDVGASGVRHVEVVAVHVELLVEAVVAHGTHVEAQLQALVLVEARHLNQVVVGYDGRELALQRGALDHVANDAALRLLVDGVGVVVVALGVGSIGEVLLEQGAVAGIVDDVEVELLRNHVARHPCSGSTTR
jgi:hypothetical protein